MYDCEIRPYTELGLSASIFNNCDCTQEYLFHFDMHPTELGDFLLLRLYWTMIVFQAMSMEIYSWN